MVSADAWVEREVVPGRLDGGGGRGLHPQDNRNIRLSPRLHDARANPYIFVLIVASDAQILPGSFAWHPSEYEGGLPRLALGHCESETIRPNNHPWRFDEDEEVPFDASG